MEEVNKSLTKDRYISCDDFSKLIEYVSNTFIEANPCYWELFGIDEEIPLIREMLPFLLRKYKAKMKKVNIGHNFYLGNKLFQLSCRFVKTDKISNHKFNLSGKPEYVQFRIKAVFNKNGQHHNHRIFVKNFKIKSDN